MSTHTLDAHQLGLRFSFDPVNDLLGSGTVGEVFRVQLVKQDAGEAALPVCSLGLL